MSDFLVVITCDTRKNLTDGSGKEFLFVILLDIEYLTIHVDAGAMA
jgi:hypothetical protein